MKRLLMIAALMILVASMLAAPASHAQGEKAASDSVVTLIKSIYKVHNNGNGPIFDREGKNYIDQYFDVDLASLIWKNVTETPSGEVGNLDFDPLYNAQDISIKNFKVSNPVITADSATVVVSFDNLGRNTAITFRLHKAAPGWRIANLIYGREAGYDLITILSRPLE